MGLLESTTQQQYYNGNDNGNYQFTSLNDIIHQFMFVYVGEDKIIPKVNKIDVAFHAKRALAELSFDTFKSFKAQEITVPATLQMTLPQDYVNYTKISWVDSAGIKHLLYPTSKTSNPLSPQQDANGDFLFHNQNLIHSGELIKNGNFQGGHTNWFINVQWDTPSVNPPVITNFTTETSPNAATSGDPQTGWFYGWNGNAIGGYNIPQYCGIRQVNVPIKSGEKYKVSIDVSGYTTGQFSVILVDENGDASGGGSISSNGTYSETLTAGVYARSYARNSVFIRNTSDTAGNIVIDNISVKRVGDEETSTTWSNYKSTTPSENNNDDYKDDTYWPANGERYGLDPQHAQVNGSFYIDQVSGKIHFSSNISGKTVILDYISDSLGTDAEMQVHKFAEEAMYKWISHAVLASKANTPEYLVARYKKERFAAIRTAKLRLSNIKLEEITQILRGKSKQIKH